MNHFRIRQAALAFALSLIVLPCLTAPAQSKAGGKLTIDRLYSLPWLIGSKPLSPVWAPDSRSVAFLWDDQGKDFYDVWRIGVDDQTPTRITSMPRPATPAAPGTDMDELEAVAAAETNHGVSSLAWSHDGRQLFFTLHGSLYAVDATQPTSASKPRRLPAPTSPVSALAPSPAGPLVAFLASDNLYTLDPASGTLTKLYTAARKDVAVENFQWSPDGRSIAFVEADSSRIPTRGIPNYLAEETRLTPVKRAFPGEPSELRRVGILPAAGGDAHWADLGSNPLDLIYGIAWSPDSETILIDKSDLYIKDRRLLLVDPATGKSSLFHREVDPRNVTDQWWSTWSPDGKGIYFLSDRDNDYHVYLKLLAGGGDPKPITAGSFAVFSAELNPSASALYLTTNQGKPEERHVFRQALTGGPLQRLTQSAGTHTAIASPDGRFLADIFSNDGIPPDLYLQATKPGSTARQVTHSPLPEFNNYPWSIAHYVDFPNVHDGASLHARITLPPNFDKTKKYPAILGSVYSNSVRNQWGGRIFHPTWGLDQYLAQQGYVILNIDISGSSGYGKLFRQRIAQDYGGVDVEDLYSGVQYLIAQGFVDPHRVGIWGSSYGGLLTSTSLFVHPGVYQAGVAGAPATSLFHALTGEMRTMMAPDDHREQYAKSSAFLKSGGLEDHLMIIHGMKDQVVLFKDSVTLEQRLITQGKDIRLVPLPNAPHGWDTEGLAQTRYAYRQLIEFFAQHLGEGPTP